MKNFIYCAIFSFSAVCCQHKDDSIPGQSPISLDQLCDFYSAGVEKRKKISGLSALSKLLQTQDVVMIKFFAHWCPPCRAWAPIVKEVAEQKELCIDEQKVKITVVEVDIDRHSGVAKAYDIRKIPTGLYYAQNRLIERSGKLTLADTRMAVYNAAAEFVALKKANKGA